MLSERLKLSSDIFGTLPETIDAGWIDDIEHLQERLRSYTVPRRRWDPFEQRYGADLGGDEGWSKVSGVLARNDVEAVLSAGWPGRGGHSSGSQP